MKNSIFLLFCCLVAFGQKTDCTPPAPTVITKAQSENSIIVSWHPDFDAYEWTKEYDKKELEGYWIKYVDSLKQSGVHWEETDYEIYRAVGTFSEKTIKQGEYNLIAITNSMSYIDTNLSEGAIYFYRVKELTKCGESDLSNYSFVKTAQVKASEEEKKKAVDTLRLLTPVPKLISDNELTINYNIALSSLNDILKKNFRDIIKPYYIFIFINNSNKYVSVKDKKIYFNNHLFTGLAGEISEQQQEIIIANFTDGVFDGKCFIYNYIKELKEIRYYKLGVLIDSIKYPLMSDIARKEEKTQIDSGGYWAFEPPLFYGKNPVLRRGKSPKVAGCDDKMRDSELTYFWTGDEMFVSRANSINQNIMHNWAYDFRICNKRFPAQIEIYERFSIKVDKNILNSFIRRFGQEEINVLKNIWIAYCNTGTNMGEIRMRQEAESLGLIPDINPSLLKFFEQIKFERCQ